MGESALGSLSKNHYLAVLERNIHFLLVERVIPCTIPFSQAVEEPLGRKMLVCQLNGLLI